MLRQKHSCHVILEAHLTGVRRWVGNGEVQMSAEMRKCRYEGLTQWVESIEMHICANRGACGGDFREEGSTYSSCIGALHICMECLCAYAHTGEALCERSSSMSFICVRRACDQRTGADSAG